MKTSKDDWKLIAGLIFVAAALRLVPHPANVSPIYSMAIFGGMSFSKLRHAFFAVIGAMLASDLIIGFDVTTPLVYLSLILTIGIGWLFREQRTLVGVLSASLLGGTLFFIISNLAVWLGQDLYPLTFQGFCTCFVMALPFFPSVIASSVVFSTLLWIAYSSSSEEGSLSFTPSRS